MDKFTYDRFTYIVNDEELIIDSSIKKPRFVFKYYSFNKNSVDALINGYLYASSSIELNDILDGSDNIFYTSKPIKYNYYKSFFADSIDDSELKNMYSRDISRETYALEFLKSYYMNLINLYGIISLSENENNPLMWPHYTNETGFQLEFNTENLEISIKSNLEIHNDEYLGFFPINYVSKIEILDISNFKDFRIPSLYINNIKLDHWAYEKEWRFLISKKNMGVRSSKIGYNIFTDHLVKKENRYAFFDKESIVRICLAPNFFRKEIFQLEFINKKEMLVKPRHNKSKNEEYIFCFLSFLTKNFPDKIYQSCFIYHEINGKRFINRAKRKICIKKNNDKEYIVEKEQ